MCRKKGLYYISIWCIKQRRNYVNKWRVEIGLIGEKGSSLSHSGHKNMVASKRHTLFSLFYFFICDLAATFLRLSCDFLATCGFPATFLRLSCDLLLSCDLTATFLLLSRDLAATYSLLSCDLAAWLRSWAT